MDPTCVEHRLTEEERLAFERDGYFQVPGVVPADLVQRLDAATDRIELPPDPRESYLLLDFIGRDDVFLELLDWPLTFPKVWGILGWHIQLYHSHIVVTPPLSGENRRLDRRLGWHQDTGRLNIELEGNPRPRVSLKVAYFLTDTSQPHRGNFTVVPGSHLRNELERSPRTAPIPRVLPRSAPGRGMPSSSTAGCGTRRDATARKSPARCCSTGTATAGSSRATT